MSGRVLVLGSGPTGLTLANLLGGFGVPVLLVERHAGTVQEPRAVSIDDESLRVMQAAGLLEPVSRDMVAGYGSRYQGPDGRVFLEVAPSERPYGHPRRNAFRQPLLEASLRQGLARFACVEARYGWTLTGFTQSPAGVRARLEGPGGASEEVAADWLAGCDGASSTVRAALGIAMDGASFEERWLICDLEDQPNPERHTAVFCDPARPAILLPGPRETRRYEFKLLPGETEAAMLEESVVARLLAAHGASPGARLVRKTVYRFHARLAERWRAGRVLLAGDAAHLTPPFAGQGMNSGIRDAHNLAWKLAAVLQGRLPAGLLASYEAERRPHAAAMIALALRMGRIMAPRSAFDGWRTRALFRGLALWPPARRYVAEMRYKPKPRFEQGFLLPDGLSARRTRVGRMLPQPEIGGRLLDDLLPPGFVLLAGEAAALAACRAPVWERLGCARLALATGLAAPGEVLLLRPDRYVAARFAASEEPAAAARLEALIAGLAPG